MRWCLNERDDGPGPALTFFSVVIPVHNKVEYLEKSLACVYGQSFQDFEVIAVDDHSSDGSLEILQQHERAGRLTLFQRSEPGPGGYAARWRAKGERRMDSIL